MACAAAVLGDAIRDSGSNDYADCIAKPVLIHRLWIWVKVNRIMHRRWNAQSEMKLRLREWPGDRSQCNQPHSPSHSPLVQCRQMCANNISAFDILAISRRKVDRSQDINIMQLPGIEWSIFLSRYHIAHFIRARYVRAENSYAINERSRLQLCKPPICRAIELPSRKIDFCLEFMPQPGSWLRDADWERTTTDVEDNCTWFAAFLHVFVQIYASEPS